MILHDPNQDAIFKASHLLEAVLIRAGIRYQIPPHFEVAGTLEELFGQLRTLNSERFQDSPYIRDRLAEYERLVKSLTATSQPVDAETTCANCLNPIELMSHEPMVIWDENRNPDFENGPLQKSFICVPCWEAVRDVFHQLSAYPEGFQTNLI